MTTDDGAPPTTAHRDALVAHERRKIRTSAALGLVLTPVMLFWKGRRAVAERDGVTLCAAGLQFATMLLTHAVNHRRADRDVAERVRRSEQARTARRSRERGDAAPAGVDAPVGRTWSGCLVEATLVAIAYTAAVRRYRQRPDPRPLRETIRSSMRGEAVVPPPTHRQITYRRRQTVALHGARVASRLIGEWEKRIRPGLRDGDRLCLAAGTTAILTDVVGGIAAHRRVPAALTTRHRPSEVAGVAAAYGVVFAVYRYYQLREPTIAHSRPTR